MIPNPNEVSAFSVYSGIVGSSKSRQRRNRHKRLLQSIEDSKVKSVKENALRKTKKSNDAIVKQGQSKTPLTQNLGKKSKKKSPKKKSESSQLNGNIVVKNTMVGLPSDNGIALKESNSASETDEARLNSIEIIDDDDIQCPVVEIPEQRGKLAKAKKMKQKIADRISRQNENKKAFKDEVKKLIKGKGSTSSVSKGQSLFESIISPFKTNIFFSEYWEKKPLYIDRGGNGEIFSQYLSTSEMDTMLRYNMLMFGKNVDITSYSEGVRETHNPEGRAHPHVVWDYFSNGCSIRILNPQTYLKKIHTLLASLQEYFGSFVGSNIYLTPANTQGFAPHYDDIEAFVLQVEGSKRWRVYNPLCSNEELPRFSSRNFSQEEIGNPIMDIVLKPGDLLYFPRGFIHQAEALPNQHSLHITVSTYQKTTWLDLIEQAIPSALARASEENIEFRKGLPIGYLRGAGLAHPSSLLRCELISKLKKLVGNLERYLDVDDAVDRLGVTFVHQALPPVLSKDEAVCSVHNGGLKMCDGNIMNRVDLSLNSRVRWIRGNAIRVAEDKEDPSQVRLYHSVDNSKEYEGEEAQFVVLDKELLPSLLHLVKAYPAYTTVSCLPCSNNNEKLVLAGDLWDRGLLVADKPLELLKEVDN